MQTFVEIKGLSKKLFLPRLGKIRLGVKTRNPKTGNEYPTETPYFVVPPEVARVYGENPTTLDIMFPVNDVGRVFPQALKWYGNGQTLKCIGNGETALRYNNQTNTKEPRSCPCEHLNQEECGPRACLQVMLPKVNMGGVYQIDSGSENSMINVNSYCAFLAALIDRIAMVPLTLSREPKQIQGPKGPQTHYLLHINLNITQEDVKQLLKETPDILKRIQGWEIPPPEEVNPAKDDSAIVVLEDDSQTTRDDVDPAPAPSPALPDSNGTDHTQQTQPPVFDDCIPGEHTTAPKNVPQNNAATEPPPSSASPKPATTKKTSRNAANKAKPTPKQREYILQLMASQNISKDKVEAQIATMSKSQASAVITQLQSEDYSAFQTTDTEGVSQREDTSQKTDQQETETAYKEEF